MIVVVAPKKCCTGSGYCCHWWFTSYHPTTIRYKWLFACTVLCMSLTVIFLPTAKQKTVTPSYSKNNIPTKTNRKHLNHQQQHDGVTFHLVLTVSNFSKLNQRCIESIFYFHPTSHVILHSNAEIRFVPQGNDTTTNIPQRLEQTIKQLTHRGYDIEILPYTAKDILQTAMTTSNSLVNQTLAKEWMSQIRTRYRHENIGIPMNPIFYDYVYCMCKVEFI
jgi:hypothetical protein